MATTGVGQISLINRADDIVVETAFAQITIEEDLQISQGRRTVRNGCSHQTILGGAAINQSTFNINCQYDNTLDDLIWQAVVTGLVRSADTETRTIPESRSITVPATPFTVTLTGLGAFASSAKFTEISQTVPTQTPYTNTLSVAPAAATEFSAEDNAGDLVITFDSSAEGKIGRLVYNRPVTGAMSGADLNNQRWDQGQLWMYMCDENLTRKLIYFPRLQRTTGWGVNNTGSALPRNFLAIVPAGWDEPFLEIDAPTLTPLT